MLRGRGLLHVYAIDLSLLPTTASCCLLPVELRCGWQVLLVSQAILLLLGALCPLVRRDPCSPLGYLVDAHIDQDHDEAGGKEGADARRDDVPLLIVDLALCHPLVSLLPALLLDGDEWWEGDDS